MNVKKAIFPVGGLGTRFLPATKSMPKEMLPVVDKPLIQYAVEEAADAGIEQFIFVTSRGKSAIENHFDHSFELENNLLAKGKRDTLASTQEMLKIPGSYAYVRQQEPAGLGHAIWCARHLIQYEPFAVILADDLIFGQSTTKEMNKNYTSGNMVAIMEVDKQKVSSYGIVKVDNSDKDLMQINKMIEKPSVENAPSNLAIIGRYILDHKVFDVLEKQERGASQEIQLTDAISSQLDRVPCLGYRIKNERFDCGSKIGFLQANISFALNRKDLSSDLSNWLKTII